jgi:hypothetical protein
MAVRVGASADVAVRVFLAWLARVLLAPILSSAWPFRVAVGIGVGKALVLGWIE